MSNEATIDHDLPEHPTYNDVRIQVLPTIHAVSTESGYAKTVKRIEDLGVSFFKKGFNNFFFLEDGVGIIAPRVEELNDAARRYGSFRMAYLRVVGGGMYRNDAFARMTAKKLDQNPVGFNIKSTRLEGRPDHEAYVRAFVYGQFAAMDNIVQKGYDLTVVAEKPADDRRKEELSMGGEDATLWWKEFARLSRLADINIASQIEQIVFQNPERTRLMAIVGYFHLQIEKHLPENLRHLCETVKLHPEFPTPEVVTFFQKIQDGRLTDTQIEEMAKQVKVTFPL
ncbi:MAG: hypothetical protein Q7S79_02870 [bacterium]|nr:hypothetical protein [bacterium]